MNPRNCVYTGRDAKATDSVVPRSQLEYTDEIHNWAVQVPCNKIYKDLKKDRPPTVLEMAAVETFFLLESARIKLRNHEMNTVPDQSKTIDILRLDVACLEAKLTQIQKMIVESTEIPEEKQFTNKQEKEIRLGQHETKILEEAEKDIDSILKERMKIWEE